MTAATAGRLSRLRYPASPSHPNGLEAAYGYTVDGHVSTLRDAGIAGTRYWQARAYNAAGQLTRFTLGNGVETRRSYSQTEILATGFCVRTRRRTTEQGRCISNTSTAVRECANKVIAQNNKPGRPGGHCMTYDANGNQVRGRNLMRNRTRTLAWTAANRLRSVDENVVSLDFRYDADRNLVKQVKRTSISTATTWYVDRLYEKNANSRGTGAMYWHYLEAGGEVVAMVRSSGVINPSSGTGFARAHYFHRDHLGSLAAITDGNQGVHEQLAFDAWGKRRWLPWRASGRLVLSLITRRGFTDHTMLDPVNLIHMGGRVYDAHTGRFLSADPYIQNALNSQSYNRYSYTLNNPLSYTDPTGFNYENRDRGVFSWSSQPSHWDASWGSRVRLRIRVRLLIRGRLLIRARVTAQARRTAAAAAVLPAPGLSAAAAGFATGLTATGDDFQAGLLNALTGGLAARAPPVVFGGGGRGVEDVMMESLEWGRGDGRGAGLLDRAVSQAIPYAFGGKPRAGKRMSRRRRPHDGDVVKKARGAGDGRFSPESEYRIDNGKPRPHNGIDYAGNVGHPIYAADDGEIELICSHLKCTESGNQVVIKHADGTFTRYFHLDSISGPLAEGDTVGAGQEIGRLGTTGNAKGTSQPHLHFEVRQGERQGIPLDPEKWLRREL